MKDKELSVSYTETISIKGSFSSKKIGYIRTVILEEGDDINQIERDLRDWCKDKVKEEK